MKYNTKLPEKVLQALMIHLDKDGDGQLSLEEFSVLYKNAAKHVNKNEVSKLELGFTSIKTELMTRLS